MPYTSVTSLFMSTFAGKSVDVTRKFYIGDSDYTQYVTKWPKVSRKWNELKPQNASVEVSNVGGIFNVFKEKPETLANAAKFQMGALLDNGSLHMLDLFVGNVTKADFKGSKANISLIDKFKKFTERVVGLTDSAVPYTNSNYLLSDILWEVITQYGGLSSVESTSNEDINYSSFLSWAEVFSSDSVLMQANFTGQKIAEIMKVAGRVTGSSIFEEEGKICFHRYATNSEQPFVITSLKDCTGNVDESRIINTKIVQGAYDVTSSVFGFTTTEANTASVNTFSPREDIEDSDMIWYVNSGSALNFSQRELLVNGFPYERYTLKTPLVPLGRSIGDTVSFNWAPLGIGGENYRLMNYEIDMNTSQMKLGVDATQLVTGFILDNTTFGALDESYNPLA